MATNNYSVLTVQELLLEAYRDEDADLLTVELAVRLQQMVDTYGVVEPENNPEEDLFNDPGRQD